MFAFGGFIAVRCAPAIIGYLLAGIIVGPFTPGFVADSKLALELAEIGVILLMFGVGTHFSVRDLMAVRAIALPGALLQIVAATIFGIGISRLWGWTLGSGLVFGLALVASTVVLLRAIEAQGRLDLQDGRIAIGWLIVEDIVMVLVLVLCRFSLFAGGIPLETMAAQNIWVTIGVTLGRIILFVAIMLVAGRRYFPWLLQRVEKLGSQELFTLAVVTLALGVAFGSAYFFGVSFALGAFFAGVVINESDLSHRATHDLQPLQNAFTALFFVSVGMLFDPAILIREPLQVLTVLAIIVIGKSLAAFWIVRLLKYPLATAWTVSVALAQIGEFSFILAGLGCSWFTFSRRAEPDRCRRLLSITINPLLFYLASKRNLVTTRSL
ncbi:cation:proton antiporter [Candidatus Villigracilis saccharophilus]|uniref:cation:proton antiporter domain-containing protein n=1 Tax=Candidatus Villigracilis saccharophilus TaxID=3140684 RepID=UPI00313593B6|nr:cation:proton antiporter [Anaerolineales bacterium]